MVTGATGFIGRQVLPHLLAEADAVHAVVRRPVPMDGVEQHVCDLLDAEAAARVVAAVRPSHLLHLAWYAVPGRFWTSDQNLLWVSSTLALARAFAEHGGERLVGAGSCAEYDWGAGVCDESATRLAPHTLYGECKRSTFAILARAAPELAVSFAWGRVFLLFGPGEAAERLVPGVVTALLEGRAAECTAGTQVRDFMDVRDVAAAFAQLLFSPVEGAVNIASGEARSVASVVRRLGELAGRPELVALGALPTRPGDPPRLEAAVRRLREEVGYAGGRPFDEALGDALAWWSGAGAREPA